MFFLVQAKKKHEYCIINKAQCRGNLLKPANVNVFGLRLIYIVILIYIVYIVEALHFCGLDIIKL